MLQNQVLQYFYCAVSSCGSHILIKCSHWGIAPSLFVNTHGMAHIWTSCVTFLNINFWCVFLEVSLPCSIVADILFHFFPASSLSYFGFFHLPTCLTESSWLHLSSLEIECHREPMQNGPVHLGQMPIDLDEEIGKVVSVDLLCSSGTCLLSLLFSKLCACLTYTPGYYRYVLLPCFKLTWLLSLLGSKVLLSLTFFLPRWTYRSVCKM